MTETVTEPVEEVPSGNIRTITVYTIEYHPERYLSVTLNDQGRGVFVSARDLVIGELVPWNEFEAAQGRLIPPEVEREYGPLDANQKDLIRAEIAELTRPPEFEFQPSGQRVHTGQMATFIARVEGSAPFQFVWRKDGAIVDGATTGTLNLPTVSTLETGTYVLSVTNDFGRADSSPVQLIIDDQASGSLMNLSARGVSGRGSEQLIASYVTEGDMVAMVRAVGPTLARFGVMGELSNPTLSLMSESEVVAFNDDWNDGDVISSYTLRTMADRVGAFPLPEGSQDAALIFPSTGGSYTVPVVGSDDAKGFAMVEVYRLSDTKSSGRLTNLAARGLIRAGESLVAGFVIGGNQARTLLVRGVGHALARYGVSDNIWDPRISIAQNGEKFIYNYDWWGDRETTDMMVDAFENAGAFPFTYRSPDAALLITLAPGAYTVQVSSRPLSSGIVLAEIYDVTGL